jgi:hypothetical protein
VKARALERNVPLVDDVRWNSTLAQEHRTRPAKVAASGTARMAGR